MLLSFHFPVLSSVLLYLLGSSFYYFMGVKLETEDLWTLVASYRLGFLLIYQQKRTSIDRYALR